MFSQKNSALFDHLLDKSAGFYYYAKRNSKSTSPHKHAMRKHTHTRRAVYLVFHTFDFATFTACTDRYQAPGLVLITVRGVWNNRLDPGTLATTVYFPVLCELFLQFSYTRRSESTTVFSQCFTFTQCTLLSRGTTASCEFLLFVVLPLYTYVFMPYQTTRHQIFVRLDLFPESYNEKCLILVFCFRLNREFHGFTRVVPRLFVGTSSLDFCIEVHAAALM